MRKPLIVALLTLALIAGAPRHADAGFKSAMKKVGHVLEQTVYVIAATVAVIVVCKSGACG